MVKTYLAFINEALVVKWKSSWVSEIQIWELERIINNEQNWHTMRSTFMGPSVGQRVAFF